MKTFKYLPFWLCMLMMCVTFSSCSDDDDSTPATANSIIGQWKRQGSTTETFEILSFKADGSGTIEDEEGVYNFKYTYSYDSSSDKGALKYWFVNSSSIYNYTITITGTTMMMTSGSSTSIWTKI